MRRRGVRELKWMLRGGSGRQCPWLPGLSMHGAHLGPVPLARHPSAFRCSWLHPTPPVTPLPAPAARPPLRAPPNVPSR